MNLSNLQKAIKENANLKKAEGSKRFFKTGIGEYGEGDLFRGLSVPFLRQLAKKAKDLDLKSIQILIDSKWHEERFLALIILIHQYPKNPHKVYQFYMKNILQINNWDLVDVSADKIVGAYCFHYKHKQETSLLLKELSNSAHMWERRIAVLTCYYFIKRKDYKFILSLAKKLLNDEEDLMHKSLGWMLREVGKRDKAILLKFLAVNQSRMPRTMLRYAIEKFSEKERKKILFISRLA